MDVPLCILPIGREAKITKIHGGINLTKRLCEMGLTNGTKITIICSNYESGPVVVEVRDSRLVLGHGVARKIFVEENL